MQEKALLAFLDKHHLPYELHSHEPLFTTEQSAVLHDELSGAHTKNLFLKDKKKQFYLVSVLDNKQVNLKQLAKEYGKGSFSFAKKEDLWDKLNLTPGSVTPFALMRDINKEITFLLDSDFLEFESVNFHPLRNDMTVNVAFKTFLQFFDLIGHPPSIISIPLAQTVK